MDKEETQQMIQVRSVALSEALDHPPEVGGETEAELLRRAEAYALFLLYGNVLVE